MPFEAQSLWTNEDPRLHLLSWDGEGTPMLLVHGLAGHAHWWDTTAPLLAKFCKPVAVDLRGCGDSGWRSEGQYEVADFVADIEHARHALGWERFIICGHSLGALISFEYAQLHSERLLGLIAVDFKLDFNEFRQRSFKKTPRQPHYPDAEILAKRFHLQPPGTLLSKAALHKLALQSIRETPQGCTWKFDWRAFSCQYKPNWPILAQIKMPSLIVRGENSAIMTRANFERAARELAGAKAVEIAKTHHHVPLDAPKVLAAEMKLFIESLEFNGGRP